MNTAVNIGLELKMSSKKEYIENFDQKLDAIFDVIDLPNLSLLGIIENIKSLTFSVDSDLVQIIIQKKLDYIVSDPAVPDIPLGPVFRGYEGIGFRKLFGAIA